MMPTIQHTHTHTSLSFSLASNICLAWLGWPKAAFSLSLFSSKRMGRWGLNAIARLSYSKSKSDHCHYLLAFTTSAVSDIFSITFRWRRRKEIFFFLRVKKKKSVELNKPADTVRTRACACALIGSSSCNSGPQ